MDKNKQWQIKNEKSIFSCKLFNIFELDCYLPSKKVSNNFISLHLIDWVNVFALTEDNKVIMVKQHRLGKNIITVEVPAGGVEKNEPHDIAAVRELEEETGYVPEKLVLLKKICVNPAIQNNTVYFYLGLNCKQSKNIQQDLTEELDIALYERDEIFKARTNELIENSVSLLSVMLAKDYLFENNL